mgnify:CR=1 FL=1
MVLHDLTLTAMVADRVLLMAGGRLAARGTPAEVLADTVLQAAFGCAIRANTPPRTGPWVLPQSVLADS